MIRRRRETATANSTASEESRQSARRQDGRVGRIGNMQREFLQEVFDYFRAQADWPPFEYLDRKLVRRMNARDVVMAMPQGFINSGSGSYYQRTDKVVMFIRALRYCTGTEEEVDDFLGAVRACVELFFDDSNPKPEISDAFFQARGLSVERVRRLGLLLGSAGLTGSGTGSNVDGTWKYEISDNIRRYRDVRALDEFIRRTPPPWSPFDGPRPKREKRRTAGAEAWPIMPTQTQSPQADFQVGWGAVHPTIARHCRSIFEVGRYDDAVFNAFKALEDQIRTRTGAGPAEVGVTLVSTALNPKAPKLQFSTVPAEQEGAHHLYRGAIALLKNPHSHRFVGIDDPVRAFEAIAFASLLLRMLDDVP